MNARETTGDDPLEMRITVSLVLSLVANGMNNQEIIAAYPYLEIEDIKACLNYAAFLASEEINSFKEVPAWSFSPIWIKAK